MDRRLHISRVAFWVRSALGDSLPGTGRAGSRSGIEVSPDRDEHRIEGVCGLFRKQILDLVIEPDDHTHLLDPPDFRHQLRTRQSVRRDPETHHAAGQGTRPWISTGWPRRAK